MGLRPNPIHVQQRWAFKWTLRATPSTHLLCLHRVENYLRRWQSSYHLPNHIIRNRFSSSASKVAQIYPIINHQSRIWDLQSFPSSLKTLCANQRVNWDWRGSIARAHWSFNGCLSGALSEGKWRKDFRDSQSKMQVYSRGIRIPWMRVNKRFYMEKVQIQNGGLGERLWVSYEWLT